MKRMLAGVIVSIFGCSRGGASADAGSASVAVTEAETEADTETETETGTETGTEPETGNEVTTVVCVWKLPAPSQYATKGKEVSAGDYDDSAEARKRRVEAAKNAKVTVQVAGHPAIVVTPYLGGCLADLPLGKVTVKVGGYPIALDLDARSVTSLYYNAGYANWRIRVDAAPKGGATCDVCR